MTQRPALILSWPKDQHHNGGAPSSAKTKRHTIWGKKNDVIRSPLTHWGGQVYSLWEFHSEGSIMLLKLTEELGSAICDEVEDARAAWEIVVKREYAVWKFRNQCIDEFHVHGERNLWNLADRMSKTFVSNHFEYIDRPWMVTLEQMTRVYRDSEAVYWAQKAKGLIWIIENDD